VTTNKSDI